MATSLHRRLLAACALALLALAPQRARADELPEYRLKAAFVYNFALFTEWPAEVGPTLQLCIYGSDPFGKELDELQGKAVGTRSIALQRGVGLEALKGCQIVFVAAPSAPALPRVLDAVAGLPVLTIGDSPAAAGSVALNMAVLHNRIGFVANLRAARAARLTLSSKLLRLASEVLQ